MAYTTINKPLEHFNTKPYTGNGSSNALTGIGFQTDMIWSKNRSRTSTNHVVSDTVRGIGKGLYPDLSNSEGNTNYISAIGSDGYTIAATDSVEINKLNDTFVSWNWKANGAGSANTAGSINSTVSANTTSGFSIVSWTGNSGTVGHGLGVKPGMIMVKSRQTSNNWVVMHKSLTGGMDTNIVVLNSTGAEGGGGAGMAEPTSDVFTITGGLAANDNNIAYCFAEKQGFSKFGNYIGNGSTDGTFVYTGFKPAFTLIKRVDSSTGGSWILFDNKRGNNVRNPVDVVLAASNNATEVEWGTNYDCDYLSNGFKWRYNGSAGYNNTSGATYIYMAFAEAPLVGTNNVPCTAR